jgi:hypothetical protein
LRLECSSLWQQRQMAVLPLAWDGAKARLRENAYRMCPGLARVKTIPPPALSFLHTAPSPQHRQPRPLNVSPVLQSFCPFDIFPSSVQLNPTCVKSYVSPLQHCCPLCFHARPLKIPRVLARQHKSLLNSTMLTFCSNRSISRPANA